MLTGHTIGQATHRMELPWLAFHTRRSPARLQAAIEASRIARKHTGPTAPRHRMAVRATPATIGTTGTATQERSTRVARGVTATLTHICAVLKQSWQFAGECRRQICCWDAATHGRATGATLSRSAGKPDLRS